MLIKIICKKAKFLLMNIRKNEKSGPAIFLDRDGTIIEEIGFLDSPEKINIIPGTLRALKIFQNLNYKLIIVSNQSGVARGFFDETTAQIVNEKILDMFSKNGIKIDGIYYCPHHPDYGSPKYKINCNCRKPKPGMIYQAVEEHKLDILQSIMIGDKLSDVLTGKNLGMESILVLTGFGKNQRLKLESVGSSHQPDYVANDIYQAALLINKMK
jgi:D-glycero-D-manno-heptose 1,7-bisphosphate phosphatase